MIRTQSDNVNYPATRLTNAIRELELEVHHASMLCLNDLMVQDMVIRVPHGFRCQNALRAALVKRLELTNEVNVELNVCTLHLI